KTDISNLSTNVTTLHWWQRWDLLSYRTVYIVVGAKSTTRVLRSIGVFTGDWPEWIDNFNAFTLLKGWDDSQKVVALPLFLEGSVKQVFQSLSADQRENWTTLCGARFLQRKQMPGETVAMFAAGLRALGNVAYMEHNNVTKEKLLLRQFLKGLEIKIAEETVRQHPTTLAAGVAAAQRALQQPRGEEPILTAPKELNQVDTVHTRDE
ncbi:hypothetical protein CBL_20097, partial [Carabus blaptoides fortunei]